MPKEARGVLKSIRISDAGLPFLEFVKNAPKGKKWAPYMEALFNNLTHEEQGLVKEARALFSCGRKVLRDIIRSERRTNAQITSIPLEALEVLEEFGQEHIGTCLSHPIYLQYQECFTNSASLVKSLPETYEYAEGVVQPSVGWPMHHAWNLVRFARDPTAIDITWPRADLHLYFGFHVSHDVFLELFKASGNMAGGFLHKSVWNNDIKRILLETNQKE